MTEPSVKTFNLAVAARNFFGAERRTLKIAYSLIFDYQDQVRVNLIVNSSLVAAANRTSWGKKYFEDIKAAGRLIVIPDCLSHLPRSSSPMKIAQVLLGRNPLHAVLRAEPLAYARALLGLAASIELTGPGSAADRSRDLPLFLLRRFTAIRLLTPSVARRFEAGLSQRFGLEIASELMSRTRTASAPYFVPTSSDSQTSAKEKLIVSASRFERRKNVVVIARALAIALPALPEWKALVLGQGEDEAEIHEILRPLLREGRVKVGYEPNIEGVLQRSSIYVSLIQPDNYPSQAVLEAMQYGNALVLSDLGDSNRFIGDPENGRLVNLDPMGVARELVAIASDERLLVDMGNSSKKLLHDSFNAARHIAELLSIHGIVTSKEA